MFICNIAHYFSKNRNIILLQFIYCLTSNFTHMTLIKTNVEKTPLFRSLISDLFDVDRFLGNDLISKAVFSEIPAANIKEDENKYEIELAVPGLSKEAFKINIENNIIEISSEQKDENTVEKKNFTRKEFSYNSFTRSFRLPESVNTDSINADYKNGLLTLTLPKKEEAKNKGKKEIKLS
jgi:HSP20 family protein